MLEGFEDAITGGFELEAEHVLFVIVHDTETEFTFVFEVLFGDFEESDFELIVIGFFGGFFLYIKVG